MTKSPTILAFDTSGPHCAAALMIDGAIVASRHEDMQRGQAERLFPMLDEVMQDTGAVWDEIDAIGVGIGPGNFTGTRIAVSAARGLGLAQNVPAIGVSTFEIYFEIAKSPAGKVAVCVPGPRESAYFQVFANGEAEGSPLFEPAIVPNCPPWSHPPDTVVGPNHKGLGYSITDSFGMAGMLTVPIPILDSLEKERATAIASATQHKFLAGQTMGRPSPLYIRPADAAPRKDAAIAIFP